MKKRHLLIGATTAAMIAASCSPGNSDTDVIFSCDEYTVYTDRVEQGEFTATAVSPTEIVTNYKSPELSGASSLVKFRFSINSRDNELQQGSSHTALIGDAASDGFVYTFGKVTEDIAPDAKGVELAKDTRWTVRVDMRPVLESFKRTGAFVTETGDLIYSDDFKGVWIAGSVEPLSWDFENLYGKDDRKLTDRGDGIYEVTLTVNPTTDVPENPTGWKTDAVDTRFPQYSSGQVLVDALYNMSIDCIASNIRPDDTYRAGAAWDGVWTRDVSYSIYLALAYLDPQRAMNSLRVKVKNGRIIQDTGTGGSWPVSSDRIVWTIAAWEIYKITGDKNWLSEAFEIADATLKDDMLVVWNPQYKLMQGEQSYLDWREQTYPRWMQPKDIYESMCLGTNVVFAEAFDILGDMAEELGKDSRHYEDMADMLENSINNNLWIPEKGYYSEYLYGGVYPIQSQTADNLGQALSVIFGVANDEMARSVVGKTPILPFGTSSVYPQIPDIKPYHNDAVWPFVQSYWNLAAAEAENMAAFEAGLGALYRSAALFGTFKELFVASNGDYRGTAVNSDKMLWSSTGNVSMIMRVFAGMEFETDGIDFDPFIPESLPGDKVITGFRYRDAVLTIAIHGTGSEIAKFEIDGKRSDKEFFPADMKGEHRIDITMDNRSVKQQPVNMTKQAWMPPSPTVAWNSISNAVIENYTEGQEYLVFRNGILDKKVKTNDFSLEEMPGYTVVDIVPVSAEGLSGFTMRPYEYTHDDETVIIEAESFAKPGTQFIKDSKKAGGFVETTREHNTRLAFDVTVEKGGTYFVDVRYANGSGPINTENKCAIRTLVVNGNRAGAIVMPQRGIGEWLSTGYSNMLTTELNAGNNTLAIEYLTPENINMNGDVNTALLDYVRIIKK
ncbi:MAG: hypothetical protein IJY31_01295 [Muribaculaceae bacterium]|nr:hypothetical protein [Muribaculaceae bacterium]